MEKPIVYEYNQEPPNFYDAFVAQVYGRGGEMFDENLEPLFNDPESGGLQAAPMAAGRLLQAPDRGAGDPRIQDHPGDEHRQARLHHRLQLRARSDEQCRRAAARRGVRSGAMPGAAHSTLGFCEALRHDGAGRRGRRLARCRQVHRVHMQGGDYQIAKRWAVEEVGAGLRCSCRCSTTRMLRVVELDRPGEVQAAGDASQERHLDRMDRDLDLPTWPLLAQAMVGEAPVAEVMDAGAAKWVEYRTLFRATSGAADEGGGGQRAGAGPSAPRSPASGVRCTALRRGGRPASLALPPALALKAFTIYPVAHTLWTSLRRVHPVPG